MFIKNIFGGKVMIPFGDWEPNSKWFQLPDGSVIVSEPESWESCEDFGKFTKEAFQEILTKLDQFKQEYTYLPMICKWLPNHLVDKLDTK